jgi:hypothetical protein
VIKFGSNADKQALDKLLATHHTVNIMIQLMDLSHNHLAEFSDRLMGGQVNIDITADVTRSASVDLRDPTHKLKLDALAPDDGSLYFTRMIRIVFIVSPPSYNTHYFVPIFTGPLTTITRNGPIVTVEAQGKESLSFQAIWHGHTYKKGLKKVDVIQMIMQAAGEAVRAMQLINRDARIGTHISASRKFTFWKLARKIANGMNLQLFYDGRGILRLRRVPGKTIFQFSDDTVMMSEPQVEYAQNDNFCNVVEVIGGKPKGKGKKKVKKIHVRVVARRNHPMSPWNLGRNGTPRYVPQTIEDDSIKSKKAARALAKRTLNASLDQAVTVSFDSLPIPYLEELDLVKFQTQTSAGKFRLNQMSIPLTVDGTSSIGYLKKTTPRVRNGRHRRRRHKAA